LIAVAASAADGITPEIDLQPFEFQIELSP
jgi:hypothetical protein